MLAAIAPLRLTAADLAAAGTVTAADGQQLPVRAQPEGKCWRAGQGRAGPACTCSVQLHLCPAALPCSCPCLVPCCSTCYCCVLLQARPGWVLPAWSCRTFWLQTGSSTSLTASRPCRQVGKQGLAAIPAQPVLCMPPRIGGVQLSWPRMASWRQQPGCACCVLLACRGRHRHCTCARGRCCCGPSCRGAATGPAANPSACSEVRMPCSKVPACPSALAASLRQLTNC